VQVSQKIGFYTLLKTPDQKGWLGALLITDDLGTPEEFRVTYPVKPTLLQSQLYGASLEPHIGVELCGKPLYQALKSRPTLLLVGDARFLSLADAVPCYVAHVNRIGDMIKIISGDQSGSSNLLSERYEPLSVTYPPSYSSERQNEAASLLQNFFKGFDLLEPLERIAIAVQALAKQDEKFR
jgi:hypothetical protein